MLISLTGAFPWSDAPGDRCPGLLQCWSSQRERWSADLDHVLHPGRKIRNNPRKEIYDIPPVWRWQSHVSGGVPVEMNGKRWNIDGSVTSNAASMSWGWKVTTAPGTDYFGRLGAKKRERHTLLQKHQATTVVTVVLEIIWKQTSSSFSASITQSLTLNWKMSPCKLRFLLDWNALFLGSILIFVGVCFNLFNL